MPDRKHNPRKLIFTLDAVHLLVGIAVVVLAVIAFLSPEEHAVFFPAIWFLVLDDAERSYLRVRIASKLPKFGGSKRREGGMEE